MKIELRKIKVCKELSQETEAFFAEVWVDDKRVGTTRNDGHGGSNYVDVADRALRPAMEAWARALPPAYCDGYPDGLTMDLDFYISLLVATRKRGRSCTPVYTEHPKK
jgi:hypothetical protein